MQVLENMKAKEIISWVLRSAIAIILLQTLYFKFTADPYSVFIFTKLGVEPYGRIALGIVELITAILILVPRTKTIGVMLSFGIISGAILSHFLVIGINVKGDNGGLFTLALVVFAACLGLLVIHKNEIQTFINTIPNRWK
jgi:putative oxidoreductase